MTLSKLKEIAADCIVDLVAKRFGWAFSLVEFWVPTKQERPFALHRIFGRTLSAIRSCLFSFRRSFCRNSLHCTLVVSQSRRAGSTMNGWFLALMCAHVIPTVLTCRRTPRTLDDALKLSVTQLRPLSSYMGAIMDRTMWTFSATCSWRGWSGLEFYTRHWYQRLAVSYFAIYFPR